MQVGFSFRYPPKLLRSEIYNGIVARSRRTFSDDSFVDTWNLSLSCTGGVVRSLSFVLNRVRVSLLNRPRVLETRDAHTLPGSSVLGLNTSVMVRFLAVNFGRDGDICEHL